VNPNNAVAHHNLGIRLYREGKVDEAEAEFIKALRLRPNYALPMNNLGICLWRRGRVDDATAILSRAVQVDPQEVVAHSSLGIALFQKGRMAAACQCFREAVRLAPDTAEYHYNLATALEEQGNHEEAEMEYQQGIRLDSGWPKKADQMARELLNPETPKMRCPPEALFRAKQASEANGNQRPDMLNTLAAAYAATGKLAEAVATERKAGELAESTGPPELVQDIRGKLQVYEGALEKQKHPG
jgi:Flp pilus assembly protein TadD